MSNDQSMQVQIESLADHPHQLIPLSRWYHQAFSHLTGELTLEQRQQNLVEHINQQPLPQSFIAVKHNQMLGGLCLVKYDCESHRQYTPWLSRVFVDKHARGQRIAIRLIDHAQLYVKALGYSQLYLLTEHKQDFFSARGFKEIARTSQNSYPLSIMEKHLEV